MRKVVDVICSEHTDESISELSHDEIWECVELGKEMPVASVLAAQTGEITEQDEQWAASIIEALPEQEREAFGGGV